MNEQEPPKIDFAPVMRECQKYAKLMHDVAEAGEITEAQFDELEGHRVSIADTFCFLIFGDKFNEIRTKYMGLVTKKFREAMQNLSSLEKSS